MSANTGNRNATTRLPAPALFVAPPSHSETNPPSLTHAGPSEKPPRNALQRQPSLLSQDPSKRPIPAAGTSYGDHLSVTSSNPSAPFSRLQKQQYAEADAAASTRAEAVWAEMQNTLEEVELSGIKGSSMTVFGAEHARALEELRRVQIDLAKAWARSEVEGDFQSAEKPSSDNAGGKASTSANATGLESVVNGASEQSQLESETERDIELSRKRREANDRYFEKVSKGVSEVVNRLEDVAKAMKSVENESKEIWGEEASMDSTSMATTTNEA